MKRSVLFFVLAIMLALGLWAGVVCSQPEAALEEAVTGDLTTADDEEYTYGAVKQISADQIVILEYDYDREETIEESYKINPNTQFENVQSATELVEADNVEIYFKEENNDKIATLIVKELFEEEEFMQEETEVLDEAPVEDTGAALEEGADAAQETTAPGTSQ